MDHRTARVILTKAFRDVHGRDGTAKELLFVQAVAWLENHYSRAGQFAPWAAQGLYNWGSLQKIRKSFEDPCPEGTMPGQDAKNPRCFLVYPSDGEAATAFVTNFTGSKAAHRVGVFPERAKNILAAMNEGASLDVARAMVSTGPGQAYFEAPVESYAKVLDGAAASVAYGLGASPPAEGMSPRTKGILAVFGALGAAAMLAWVTDTGPFEPKPAAYDRMRRKQEDPEP